MSYTIKFESQKEIVNFRNMLDFFEVAKDYKEYPNWESLEKDMKKLKSKLSKCLNKNPIKIFSRKAKGRDLQKFVCERLAKIFDILFDNQDDQCLIHSREMGQSGTDVILRGEIFEKFKFDIECKATENFTIYADIEQAKRNKGVNRDWILVHKKKHKTPIVIMEWEAFENLIKKTIC